MLPQLKYQSKKSCFLMMMFFLRHYGIDYAACNIYLKLYLTATIPASQLLLEILCSHTHLFCLLRQAHLRVLSVCTLNLL